MEETNKEILNTPEKLRKKLDSTLNYAKTIRTHIALHDLITLLRE